MADQATKSIRRIVKGLRGDPTGLGAADDYKGLGTSRGEAFINARGDVTGSASTGSGDDIDEQPSSGTPNTGNPDDNDTGGGGGVNDGSDPGGSLGGDVADVDATTTTDSQIGTVTGTDPTTANFSSLNINTLEGIEYIPPDGWADPDTPPPVEDWVQGFEWQAMNPEFGDHPSKSLVKGSDGATLLAAGYVLQTDDSVTITYFKPFPPFFGGPGNTTFSWSRAACTPTQGDPTCPVENPSANDPHPSDGSCSVVFDVAAGGYKGHELDPDCSAAQQSPTDFVIIRSVSDPSKYFRYTKLANGGTKITQVDAGGVPVPGTITKTTDEGGRVDGFFDVALDAGIT